MNGLINIVKFIGFTVGSVVIRKTYNWLTEDVDPVPGSKEFAQEYRQAEIKYKPDFAYTENDVRIYEDVKGVETEGFRIKSKLWKKYGPGPLRITKRKGTKSPFTITKTIYVD